MFTNSTVTRSYFLSSVSFESASFCIAIRHSWPSKSISSSLYNLPNSLMKLRYVMRLESDDLSLYERIIVHCHAYLLICL